MKASRFTAELKSRHDVSLVLVDGKAQVTNVRNLPRYLKIAVARHRSHLQAFLAEGIDVELDREHRSDDELLALGCREILAQEIFHNDGTVTQKWTWTSDQGDEHLDMILCGLLDAGAEIEQRKAAEAASREAEFSVANPPRGSILGRGFARIPGL
jgi:hypothetical protein